MGGFSSLSVVQTGLWVRRNRPAVRRVYHRRAAGGGLALSEEGRLVSKDHTRVRANHRRLPAPRAVGSQCVSDGKPGEGLISENTQALHFTVAPLSGDFISHFSQ